MRTPKSWLFCSTASLMSKLSRRKVSLRDILANRPPTKIANLCISILRLSECRPRAEGWPKCKQVKGLRRQTHLGRLSVLHMWVDMSRRALPWPRNPLQAVSSFSNHLYVSAERRSSRKPLCRPLTHRKSQSLLLRNTHSSSSFRPNREFGGSFSTTQRIAEPTRPVPTPYLSP